MGNFIESIGKVLFKGDNGHSVGSGAFLADNNGTANTKNRKFEDELIAQINPGYNPAHGDPSTIGARLGSGNVQPS